MSKLSILNRHGKKVVVLPEINPVAKGLAFIAHGLGWHKDHSQIQGFAETFQKCGYSTVRYDATNAIGESDGQMEDATLTNYYEDLEDVIAWAKTQAWYQEPFVLCGHSLGSACCILFSEKYPELVKGLAPFSAVVSGKLILTTHPPAELQMWQATGIREWESSEQKGLIKRLKWQHIEDRNKYDLLPDAPKLTMPILLIVGSLDTVTPPAHQQILFEAIPHTQKELHVIEGAPHGFFQPEYLTQVQQILETWIKKLRYSSPSTVSRAFKYFFKAVRNSCAVQISPN